MFYFSDVLLRYSESNYFEKMDIEIDKISKKIVSLKKDYTGCAISFNPTPKKFYILYNPVRNEVSLYKKKIVLLENSKLKLIEIEEVFLSYCEKFGNLDEMGLLRGNVHIDPVCDFYITGYKVTADNDINELVQKIKMRLRYHLWYSNNLALISWYFNCKEVIAKIGELFSCAEAT